MNKELDKTIFAKKGEKEEPDKASKLVSNIVLIRELRRKAEADDLAAGASVAEDILIRAVPTFGFIVDGNLRDEAAKLPTIKERVAALPDELVADTADRIQMLLSFAEAVPSITSSLRLTAFLPFALPKTREGLSALKCISTGFRSNNLLPNTEKLTQAVTRVSRQLTKLDNFVVDAAKQDESLLDIVIVEAQAQAALRIPEMMKNNSEEIQRLRRLVAEEKIRFLRRNIVTTKNDRDYTEYEVRVTEIIERDSLNNETSAIQTKQAEAQSKAEQAVLASIARKRAAMRVAELIDSDLRLKSAIAKRLRIPIEDLEVGNEQTRRQATSNALNIRNLIISTEGRIEDRVVFNGETIIQREQKMLDLELKDPLLFIASLTDEEVLIIRRGIPRISDNKSVFNIAKERLKQEIEQTVTEDELAEILTQKIISELILERSEDAVDTAIKQIIDNTELLFGETDILKPIEAEIVTSAVAMLKVNPARKVEIDSPIIEIEQPAKPYKFVVPAITIGKSQLLQPENLLRFGTSVTTAQTAEKLQEAIDRLIQSSKEFEGYFSSDGAVSFYPPEKKAEMLFSMVGRGAGSKLAGTPLFELTNECTGILAVLSPSLDRNVQTTERYGGRIIVNSVRLSPLSARIGSPYADRLVNATGLVAECIDTVSGNLNAIVSASGTKRTPVEEITAFTRANLNKLVNQPRAGEVPGRSVVQMDFFLLYPPEIRRTILQSFADTGSIEPLLDDLAARTTNGDMRMTIFDISGGSGGVGITEILSKQLLGKQSGHMDSYLQAVLGSCEDQLGRPAEQIVIAPRAADLTLMNFEYLPVEQALIERGVGKVGITTLELLEQSIEVAERTGKKLTVPTLNGLVLTPDLIIKRFTFPKEGNGTGYRGEIIPSLPGGVILEPNNSSRVVASDKRINSRILDALSPQLTAMGVDVMPFLDIEIGSGSLTAITEEIVEFMKRNRDAFPEMDFLGAVLKTGDKIPGRAGGAGEVISAYPIPASVMTSPEMQRLFIAKKVRELSLKGVTGIVVQPNVLSLVVDSSGLLMPKFELKMMAFANKKG